MTVDSEGYLGKARQDGYTLTTNDGWRRRSVVRQYLRVHEPARESLAVVREIAELQEQGSRGSRRGRRACAAAEKGRVLQEVPRP